jgi:hypothetical protein
MGSSTNRSLQAKYKKAIKQRQELGAIEGAKPAYHSNKPALRELAASSQLMVKPSNGTTIDSVDSKATVYVMYNPSIYRAAQPLALRCAVACDGELVRRKDYFRR